MSKPPPVSCSPSIDLENRIALRPAEAATVLGVSNRTIRKWMKQENLPFFRVDGVILIPRGDLIHWIAARTNSEAIADSLAAEILEGFQ